MILYCASDLIWATKIKGTGEELGIACRPVRNLEMLEARLVDSPVRALIVDLEAGDVGRALISRLRMHGSEADRAVKIVAFGPHVAIAEFDAARKAGADVVLARGAFNSRLGEILKSLAESTSMDR